MNEIDFFNPAVVLTDKQWAHFMETMTNPAPPTDAMRNAHRLLDELRALRAQIRSGEFNG